MAEASRSADFPVRKIENNFLIRFLFATSLGFFAACQPGGEEAIETDSAENAESSETFSIEIVDFEGLQAHLAENRGEGMLLNFWAMWCAPCVAELPELNEVADAYRARGGKVVGVSYDLMVSGSDPSTIKETIRDFLKKRGLNFPVLIYDADDHSDVNEFYSLPGEIPSTIALNKAGEIVDREDGQTNAARFEELMKKATGL